MAFASMLGPVKPELYKTPPDIEGASVPDLLAALHLFERRWMVEALRKILAEHERRLSELDDPLRPAELETEPASDVPSRNDIIRDQADSGMTNAEIARAHGISAARVSQIVRGG